MIPIPFFYEVIDRNAIIVRPKKPFYDWLQYVYPDTEPDYKKDENNIYLIREMDNNEQILQWLKRNFDKIFINELNDFNTNKDKWPKKRTWKLFSEWFDIEIASMILDLEDSEVTKE